MQSILIMPRSLTLSHTSDFLRNGRPIWSIVASGVPLGSVIGPFVFVIYKRVGIQSMQSILIMPRCLTLSLGCPSRTKFWSSDFCFAPKLNLGLVNFKLFFWNFLTSGSLTPMSSKISTIFLYNHIEKKFGHIAM